MSWFYLETDQYGSVSGWGTNRYDQYIITNNQIENAKEIYNNLYARGWSNNAICAVIGNLMWESLLNPAQYEYGTRWASSYGLGLAMWTPRSKWISFADSHNYQIYDGAAQCEWLVTDMWDTENGWKTGRQVSGYPGMPYYVTPDEFYNSTADVTYLANVFGCNYEGGTYSTLRGGNAEYWNTYFQGYTPVTPTPPTPQPTPPTPAGLPIWMYFKFRKR